MIDHRIVVILGTTGSGKTTMLRRLLNREHRCFLFDPIADEKLQDYGVLVDNVKDATHLVINKGLQNFHVRFQFDEPERFDFVCDLAMRIKNCTIAIDEISLFCSSYSISDAFKKVIRLGRHSNVRIIATTQRAPDVNLLLLSQAKCWYIFQMHLSRDIETLSKFIPNAPRARRLATGQYILWTPEVGGGAGKESGQEPVRREKPAFLRKTETADIPTDHNGTDPATET